MSLMGGVKIIVVGGRGKFDICLVVKIIVVGGRGQYFRKCVGGQNYSCREDQHLKKT